MLKMIQYRAFLLTLCLFFQSCSSVPPPSEELSGAVLFMGVRVDAGESFQQNPFNAYVSDRFSHFAHSALLLSGEKLNRTQNAKSLPLVCRSIRCESKEARSLHVPHLLDIHISPSSTPGTLFLTLTTWNVSPLTLERMVSRRILLSQQAAFDALPAAMEELVSTRGLYFSIKDTQPESGPGKTILHMISRGQTERALALGEKTLNSQPVQSPTFFNGYFQALVLSGQAEKATLIGETAIQQHAVTPQLIVGLRRLEKDLGHSGKARSVLYRGLMELPDSRLLWSYVIEDQVKRKNNHEALRLANLFIEKHPGKKIPERMIGAIYAAYVFSDQGQTADDWASSHNIINNQRMKPELVKHAILFRLLQKGQYEKVVVLARKWILRGPASSHLFQDLMIAEGGLNEPISEARTARNAIASGHSNSWILSRLSDLAVRGY
ncbi:hypothetical protein [Leptospirillum ferrooxidans]|jgi:hypothetical protein|nr:hypothetical protein [Leptospirillum ferrooxidans]